MIPKLMLKMLVDEHLPGATLVKIIDMMIYKSSLIKFKGEL